MNIHLTENKDYTWVEKSNSHGYKFQYLQLTDGRILDRKSEPYRNSVVLFKNNDKLIPVLIKDGEYYSNGRLSNYWYWYEINEDFSLSELKSGYGNFYESHLDFKVKIEITVSL